MRALILVAGAALALAGCRNNDQHDNTMNVDENLTAESIVSNDVTAIDAVTGDAANMAADVNYENMSDNSVANLSDNTTTMPRPREKRASPAPTPATSQSSGNIAANSAE